MYAVLHSLREEIGYRKFVSVGKRRGNSLPSKLHSVKVHPNQRKGIVANKQSEFPRRHVLGFVLL